MQFRGYFLSSTSHVSLTQKYPARWYLDSWPYNLKSTLLTTQPLEIFHTKLNFNLTVMPAELPISLQSSENKVLNDINPFLGRFAASQS